MLNDWKWEKISNHEYIIRDDNYKTVIDLLQTPDKTWVCIFCDVEYQRFSDDMTIEEMQWQAVVSADKLCNKIANNFHHIRDHLPSMYSLFDKTRKL